jgi:hypothetical protein
VKLYFKALPLACLALLTLCAISTRPQNRSIYFPLLGHTQENAGSNGKTQQEPVQDGGVSTDATSACAYTFTSGSGDTSLKYCVTVNGNIAELQSPSGIEYIKNETVGEGYGLCDGGAGREYYDWAGAGTSANWDKPVLLTHTATEVKIERTTSDGVWTLTQTITQNAAGAYAKIEMQFKNNSDVAKGGFFMRWANVNADSVSANNLDGSVSSAWAYVPFSSTQVPYGLLLQNSGNATVSHFGYALNTNQPPDVCEPGLTSSGTLTATDGSVLMLYAFGGLARNTTATINVKYTAF